MSSLARDILLEIKRRLGDVNAPVPEEVDMMAFLNRALHGIWNYGLRLHSPALQKAGRFTSNPPENSVEIPDGVSVIVAVYDHELSRMLSVVDPAQSMMNTISRGERVCFLSGNGLEISPPFDRGVDLSVCYIPDFQPLSGRDATLPFPSRLDEVVTEWAVMLMTKKAETVSDVAPGLISHGNTLSEYFRGATSTRKLTVNFPW